MNSNQKIQLKDEIARYVKGKRYLHTLAVERECSALSCIYGLDAKDAERLSIAAFLHDITKEIDTEGQIDLCKRFGIPFDSSDIKSPKVFHAKTGAYFAREKFPALTDDVVFGCIRWHTTGRAGMSLPEKLLYLADYIEETRDFDDCIELRRYFYSRIYKIRESEKMHLLNQTLVLSFDMTIRNLLEEGGFIYPDTINSRNHLLTGA